MLTAADNILGEDRAVLMASLLSNFSLNFGEIITEEMRIRVTQLNAAYLFPYLIMRLCNFQV